MMVKVLFFGAIADKLGIRSLDVQANYTLGEVIKASGCIEFHPFMIAVNQEQITDMNYILQDGDEVALMPPFSGG